MSKLFSTTLIALTLMACATDLDASSFRDRNPAQRTTGLGLLSPIDRPTNADGLELGLWGSAEAFDGRVVVEYVNAMGCGGIALYTAEDAESGVRAPRAVREICATGESLRLWDAHHGLALVDGSIYAVLDDGIELEADLSGAFRDPDVLGAVVLDEATVALRVDGLVRVFRKSMGTWAESERIEAGVPRQGWEDHLVTDEGAYAFDGQRWNRVADLADPGHPFANGPFVQGEEAIYSWEAGWFREIEACSAYRTGDLYLDFDDAFVGLRLLSSDCVDLATLDVGGQLFFAPTFALTDDRVFVFGDEPGWITPERPAAAVDVSGILLDERPVVLRHDWIEYAIEVPVGATNLQVTLSGTGDADLYVREGSPATEREFDCSPYRFGSDESCHFAAPAPGTWYVGVAGFDPQSDVRVLVTNE